MLARSASRGRRPQPFEHHVDQPLRGFGEVVGRRIAHPFVHDARDERVQRLRSQRSIGVRGKLANGDRLLQQVLDMGEADAALLPAALGDRRELRGQLALVKQNLEHNP